MKKLPIDKQWLEEKYVQQGLSSAKIAAELGCNSMTILNKLKQYGIPARKDGILHPSLTKEFLEQEYVVNGKGMQQIAKETSSSYGAVRRRMKAFDIIARPKDSLKDLSGEAYGEWTVLERQEGDRLWKCRCSCGKVCNVGMSNLVVGSSTCCRYCARVKHIKEKHSSWKGHKEFSGTAWMMIKNAAKKRQIPFDLTIEAAWDLYIKQDRKCALTGWPISFAENSHGQQHGEATASLDRISSVLGYVKGNIQWTHKDVNRMKSNFDQNRFVEVCKAVSAQATSALPSSRSLPDDLGVLERLTDGLV